MKPKQEQNYKFAGFTLIELMVVVAIMALMAAALIVDFNRNRVARSIQIAKNETASNIRKAQGYLLSSKNITGNTPAKFYIVTLMTSGGGTSYTIDAIDNTGQYKNTPVETINLPSGVKISDVRITINGNQVSQSCMQIVFAAPLGEEYVIPTCGANVASIVSDPVQLAAQSQGPAYIYFQGVTTTVTGSNYVEIFPLTGQILTH